jgi:hypothetical protein
MKRTYESTLDSTNEKQGTKVSNGNEKESNEIFYNSSKVS